MRLTLKLAIVLCAGVAAVMLIYAYTVYLHETGYFQADMEKDAKVVGHALVIAVRSAWKVGGEATALDLVQRANRDESTYRIRWVWPDAPADSPHRPIARAEDLHPLKSGESVVLPLEKERGPKRLYSYFPVLLPDNRIGALELSESFEELERFAHETLVRIAATTAIVVLVCGGLALLLGTKFVGRPVAQLVDSFRRVGAGDLDHRPNISMRDELGVLAVEFSDMSDRLAEARKRGAEESAKRLEAQEQLRHADRLRAVGQLTAGVAHELGTPLHVVWARASMIARGEAAGDEAKSCATVIEEQSQRMTRIIRKLLDFARPRPPQRALVDLNQIIHQTFDVLGSAAKKQNVILEFVRNEIPATAQVDAGQIQQVLTNLILNAIQAMPNGGRVRVGVRNVRIRPPADHGGPDDEYLYLFVEDHGTGIAEADLPKIFEPFFTTKDVGEGTGLGLSISRGIIQEHLGWISVVSRPGEGARFNVYLPRGSN